MGKEEPDVKTIGVQFSMDEVEKMEGERAALERELGVPVSMSAFVRRGMNAYCAKRKAG